jgi:hypothetical protein
MKFTPCLWSLLASLLCASAWAANDLTLYVSPHGNDQWSGQKADPAADGKDGPLATLEGALQTARKLHSATRANAGKTSIFLRQGTYWLDKPIVLGSEASGLDAAQPFLIAAYAKETPVLSGGRRLTGWKPVPGNDHLWQAEVAEAKQGWYFHQLFVDGKRKQRARTPNEGFYHIQGASPEDRPVKLKYRPGDIKPEWAKDGDVEVVAYLAWADFRLQIRAVDEASHVATLAGDPAPSNKESDAQYYIENAPDALDQPGEWYLNRRTGIVTYWPERGEDLTQAMVIAPKLTSLLQVHGDAAQKKPVRHLILRGLTLAHTDWTLEDRGYTDVQAAIHIHGDIEFAHAQDCAIDHCTLEHLAGYAIELGRGCQRVNIVHNTIHGIGAGGLRVGEGEIRKEAFDANHSHQIADNQIYDLGIVYKPAVGILVLQSGQNQIAHNHVHDLCYTAISVGWNWGYQETPCRENIIEFNDLHDIGKSRLSDMGAIYTLGIQKGTVIRNNLIHDVYSYTYGGWGIYPDEGSTDILIENNVVYRTKSAGFHQHYGRDNIVRNNIFAYGKENQVMRTREEDHQSFRFERNIVYFDSGNLLGSNWAKDRYDLDYNCYFDARPGAAPDSLKFAGATFEEWRKRGHDQHSIIADPLFVNPSAYDFRLQPESPALKLGFTPIDLKSVGPRSN